MFPDESIDFVFSLDSLVHPRREIIEAYLTELGKKLKTGDLSRLQPLGTDPANRNVGSTAVVLPPGWEKQTR